MRSTHSNAVERGLPVRQARPGIRRLCKGGIVATKPSPRHLRNPCPVAVRFIVALRPWIAARSPRGAHELALSVAYRRVLLSTKAGRPPGLWPPAPPGVCGEKLKRKQRLIVSRRIQIGRRRVARSINASTPPACCADLGGPSTQAKCSTSAPRPVFCALAHVSPFRRSAKQRPPAFRTAAPALSAIGPV